MSGATSAIAIGGMVASAASTAMSVVGQSQQAQAAAQAQRNQAKSAQYQAQVARNNQQVADWNAANVKKVGLIQEDQQREKTSLIEGAQRAALASQGGDVTSGSTVDILGDTARAGEMDAETIRSNTARAAWGYEVQGMNAGAQAGLYDNTAQNLLSSADSATAALPFAVGSSLLGGISSTAGKAYDWMKNDPKK